MDGGSAGFAGAKTVLAADGPAMPDPPRLSAQCQAAVLEWVRKSVRGQGPLPHQGLLAHYPTVPESQSPRVPEFQSSIVQKILNPQPYLLTPRQWHDAALAGSGGGLADRRPPGKAGAERTGTYSQRVRKPAPGPGKRGIKPLPLHRIGDIETLRTPRLRLQLHPLRQGVIHRQR